MADKCPLNAVSHSNASLFFWRQHEPQGNFGDALSLALQAFLLRDGGQFRCGEIHLIGSVITPRRITSVLETARKRAIPDWRPVFWGCGKKDGTPLPPELFNPCRFLGVRGVDTRDALGLPRDTPLGDTALLLPRFYAPSHDAATSGKVLWVPHIHHPDPTPDDLAGCPDHRVMRPSIPNSVAACQRFIDAIASARFVMANAMHAAVVALAYGVPFAFWSGSSINHPFKWTDFTSGLGFHLPFSRTYAEGLAHFQQSRPDRHMAVKDMSPMLTIAAQLFE